MGVPGIGRRQKPEALRVIQGSKRRPTHHTQPRPPLGRPRKPDYLGPIATAMWDELAALLEGERRLSQSDGLWLTKAADAWVDYQRLRVEAETTPLTQTRVTVDGSGQEHRETKMEPVHQQVRLARKAFTDLLKEAGLTPTSRARVVMPPADDAVDPTEVFLRKLR